VGLARLVQAPPQHRRALPRQPARAAFAGRGVHGDVQAGEPDRLPGGGEPSGPAQPAHQRQPGDRPDPVQPLLQLPGPARVPGDPQQLPVQDVHLRLGRLQHQHRGVDLGTARRRQLLGSDLGQPGPSRRRPQIRTRGRPLVEQHRMDPLHPRRVITAKVVVAAQQRPRLHHLRGWDPALREPARCQQFPLMAGVGPVGLGPLLAPPQVRRLRRFGQMRAHPRRRQLLRDVPPPGAPLHRELDLAPVLPITEPTRQPRGELASVSGRDLPHRHLPGLGVQIVEGDLLPVNVQPAYDGHQGPPHAPGTSHDAPGRYWYRKHPPRLSWGGPLNPAPNPRAEDQRRRNRCMSSTDGSVIGHGRHRWM
jgi:hypothetical protein